MLNEKASAWILSSELTPTQAQEVVALVGRLGLSLEANGRMAPSVIVRSELELFGSSSPRFAYRLYFKESKGFVNVRRLNRVRIGISDAATNSELSPQQVSDILKSPAQSCIADCLLPRPRHWSEEKYHIIQAKLSAAYGESCPLLGIANYAGTPYVKNITLGGGLCTQACCFQSVALLNEFASGIHGLAEITAIAHSIRRHTLDISGMNIRQMQRYFSSISLSVIEQVPHFEAMEMPRHRDNALEFETALKAYCQSGMPVIVPVDLGRMVGFNSRNRNAKPDNKNSIYHKNNLDVDYAKFDHTQATRHCFVVVGCEKYPKKPGEAGFLFNDPGGAPFMHAKTHEIVEVGPYLGESDNIERFRFWPVTPASVKMPLLDFKLPGDFTFRGGLRFIADSYRKELKIAERFPTSFNFILSRLRDFNRLKYFDPIHSSRALPNAPRAFLRELVKLSRILQDCYSWSEDHWVWLEMMPDAIWVWDAEIEPNYDDPRECLITSIRKNGNLLTFSWSQDFEINY